MGNREDFLRELSEFFDSGAIREIYANDNISLLNISNSIYVGTNYYKDKNDNTYLGLILGVDQMREAIKNNNYIFKVMANASKKVLKQVLVEFNDRALEIVKRYKDKTDKEGPSEYIDFDFEAELERLARNR